jgi:hypothetical protein
LRAPRPANPTRTSTLHQPTKSSLARMQATIRPTDSRPLAQAPARDLITPYGKGSSRGSMYDESFNAPDPSLSACSQPMPAHVLKPAMRNNFPASPARGAGGTPKKTASAAAMHARHRASGLSAVKSRGNMKSDADVAARRADIRAKQQRMEEERELRDLLRMQ